MRPLALQKGPFGSHSWGPGTGPEQTFGIAQEQTLFRGASLLLLGWSQLTLLSILFLLILKEAAQGQGASSRDPVQETHYLVGKEAETPLTRICDIFK